MVGGNADFYDPLRGGIDNDAKSTPPDPDNLSETSADQPIKEWTSFRRLLMQRFPVSKMVSLSSVSFTVFPFFGSYKILKKVLCVSIWWYLRMAEGKVDVVFVMQGEHVL